MYSIAVTMGCFLLLRIIILQTKIKITIPQTCYSKKNLKIKTNFNLPSHPKKKLKTEPIV